MGKNQFHRNQTKKKNGITVKECLPQKKKQIKISKEGYRTNVGGLNQCRWIQSKVFCFIFQSLVTLFFFILGWQSSTKIYSKVKVQFPFDNNPPPNVLLNSAFFSETSKFNGCLKGNLYFICILTIWLGFYYLF